MKKKQWRKKFENEYLDLFVQKELDFHDSWELVEFGKDFFSININNNRNIRYRYDKELVKRIYELLNDDWEIEMQFYKTTIDGTNQYIEIKHKVLLDKIVLEVKPNLNSDSNKGKAFVSVSLELVNLNHEDVRDVIYKVKNLIAKEIPFSSDYILELYSWNEINDFFDLDANHLSITIDDFNFSMRAYNCLKRDGYKNVIDILWHKKENISSLPQLGKKSCDEIIEKVEMLDIPWNLSEYVTKQLEELENETKNEDDVPESVSMNDIFLTDKNIEWRIIKDQNYYRLIRTDTYELIGEHFKTLDSIHAFLKSEDCPFVYVGKSQKINN